MNICIITNGYPANSQDYQGAFCHSFAITLKNFGHNVFIFTPNKIAKKEERDGVCVHWFSWLGGKKSLINLNFFNPSDLIKIGSLIIRGKRDIIEYCKMNKIDFCLALWALPSGYFAMHAKKKLGIPYAVWCLGSDINMYAKYPIIKNIIKTVLQNADALYADGIQMSESVKRISLKNCEFLSTTRILPKIYINVSDVDKNKKNYVFIGRLEHIKGIDTLIDAMRLLLYKKERENMRLYIFGSGSQGEYVKEKIIEYGLAPFVYYKGYANQDDVSRYLQQCDWCIIPSRSDSIPVVFSESLQANTPLIVSDVGDMGHLVRKYKVGLVARPNDPENLSETIISTLTSEADDYLGYTKNIPLLAQEFNIENTVKKFIFRAQELVKKNI